MSSFPDRVIASWAGTWLFVGVPALGLSTIVAVRLIAWWTQPQLFAHTLPTVSKTAALPPGSWVFAFGMVCAAAIIVLVWSVIHALDGRLIERLAADGMARRRYEGLAGASVLAGIAAAGVLAALAVISLETDDAAHVLLSKVFFGMQVLALAADALLAYGLRRDWPAGEARPAGLRARVALCLLVTAVAGFFLLMFVTKDASLIGDRMVVRWLYVGAENVLCALFFLYALTYLPLLREERLRVSAQGAQHRDLRNQEVGERIEHDPGEQPLDAS